MIWFLLNKMIFASGIHFTLLSSYVPSLSFSLNFGERFCTEFVSGGFETNDWGTFYTGVRLYLVYRERKFGKFSLRLYNGAGGGFRRDKNVGEGLGGEFFFGFKIRYKKLQKIYFVTDFGIRVSPASAVDMPYRPAIGGGAFIEW